MSGLKQTSGHINDHRGFQTIPAACNGGRLSAFQTSLRFSGRLRAANFGQITVAVDFCRNVRRESQPDPQPLQVQSTCEGSCGNGRDGPEEPKGVLPPAQPASAEARR
jgi:hypothetical protein